MAAILLLSGLPGDTKDTAFIRHLLGSLGCTATESIRSLVKLKSAEVRLEQLSGSFPETTNWRSRELEVLPLVELIVSVGAMLS